MVKKFAENVNNGYFLSDLSPQDVSWDRFKTTTVTLSNILVQKKEFAKRAYAMNDCSEWLRYAMTNDLDKPLKLRQASFCRDRVCPLCSWRRSLRWKATMHKQLPAVREAFPKHKWIFVTLTVKNCHISDLRVTIGIMNRGFNALVRKLKNRIGNIGYVKSVEVTRAKDDTAHPHFHVLFFFPASYFKKTYLKTLEWVTLWQECTKLSYAPSVDVRAIYSKRSNGGGIDDTAINSAVAETAKYATKSADFVKPDKTKPQDPYWWFYEYLRQIKGLRFISVGGCLKGLIKPEWLDAKTNDEMIHFAEDEKFADEEEILIQFNFHRVVQRYWYNSND